MEEFAFESSDGVRVHAYEWRAENPKAAVQIAHGAAEHALRYDPFAKELVSRGYSVYASDHRGHGRTAGSPQNTAYFSDRDGGFDLAVSDMRILTERIRKENPGLPVFLLGHSMGSLLARVYASRYGNDIDGLLLTGTGRAAPPLLCIVKNTARLMMALFGRKHRSKLLHSLVFGTLNAPFKKEGKSAFICADRAVVEAYRADEYCGNLSTAEFVYELMKGTRAAFRKAAFDGVPKALPVFIGSGEFDAMGGKGLKGVKADFSDYKKAGLNDVEFHIYPGMRHEILNEKDKGRVYSDIVRWLDERTDGKKAESPRKS